MSVTVPPQIVLPTAIEEGAGQPALVLLHGVGSTASVWRPQLRHFGRGRATIAWNMPGYADSPALGTASWHGWAECLAALISARGLGRVHLLGHSLGGMIAQDFAARYPGRLASLVLSGTSPAFGRSDGEWQQAWVRQRLAPLEAGGNVAVMGPEIVAGLIAPGADPSGVQLAIESVAGVPNDAYADAIRLIAIFDRRDNLARIAVPTLVLAGEKDTNAPAAMMEKMAAKISGARYVCLAGRGHLANVEDAAAFNAAIDSFLASLKS